MFGHLVWDARPWQLTATTTGLVAAQNSPVNHGGLDLVEPATGRIAWRSTIGHPAFLAAPAVVGSNIGMVVQLPQNGPSFALLRNLTTGSLVARYRLGSSQAPLTFAVLGPDLYGPGFGRNGKTASGFVERIGLDGVIWRVILPQPA